MSTYNGFVYNEDVYNGSEVSPDIRDVRFIASNVILVTFAPEVVVNEGYFNISEISLIPITGAPIRIRSIQPVNNGLLTTTLLNIVTDNAAEGGDYTIIVPPYQKRNGDPTIATSAYIKYTRTKVDTTLVSIPTHYDKDVTSNLRGLLTAIAGSDEIIGGSRSDLA